MADTATMTVHELRQECIREIGPSAVWITASRAQCLEALETGLAPVVTVLSGAEARDRAALATAGAALPAELSAEIDRIVARRLARALARLAAELGDATQE